MLRRRVIFTLLINNGFFMLSRNFRLQQVGDINWLMKNYKFSTLSFSIDELIILDVSRSEKNQDTLLNLVQSLSRDCFIPFAVGGGITDLKFAQKLLNNGADKIIINSLLVDNLAIVREMVSNFGSQCIVASIDIKKNNDEYRVFTHNGSKMIDISIHSWIDLLSQIPVGEIFLNSMDRDGTGQGFDKNLLDHLPANIEMPIIISGGAGKPSHLIEALQDDRVDAVATANLFNFIGNSLADSRIAMFNEGLNLAKWDIELKQSLNHYFEQSQ